MSFNAKVSAVFLLVTAIVSAIYIVAMAGELSTTPVSDIAYQGPVLVGVGAFVILFVVGIITVSIHAAISERRSDVDVEDERDERINLRGDQISNTVVTLGAVAVLGLVMVEVEYFWIAQAILAVVVGASVIRWIAVLAYDRRGI